MRIGAASSHTLATAALAHKVYLQACFDNSWLGMFIAWAVIVKLEG